MWAIFTSKLGLVGIACALVFSVIGVQTVRLNHAKHELADLKAANKAAMAELKVREAKGSEISSQASVGIKAAHEAVAQKIAPLVRRIREEVPEGADRGCSVPKGFISLWNSAVP